MQSLLRLFEILCMRSPYQFLKKLCGKFFSFFFFEIKKKQKNWIPETCRNQFFTVLDI